MGIHHLDLVVTSLERSVSFYRELLEPLGYTRVGTITGEQGETVWYLGGTGRGSIGLREARSPGPGFDRYRVGVHHLAVGADSREQVDERAEWLRARGAELESGPQEYGYMPGYYAVFFYDPDRLKLELVHVPD